MSEPQQQNNSFENTYFTEEQLLERFEKKRVEDLSKKQEQERQKRIEDLNNVEQLHLNLPGVPVSSRPADEQPEDQELDGNGLPQEPENPEQQKLSLR